MTNPDLSKASIFQLKDTKQCPMPIDQTKLNTAVQRLNSRDFDAVVHICNQILKEKSAHVVAYNLKGIALSEMGKFDEAIQSFLGAIDHDTNFVHAYFNLSKTLQKAGRPEDAISRLQDTLRLDRTYLAAHHSLGNLYKALGENEEAISSYRNAINLNQQTAVIYRHLAQAKKFRVGDEDLQTMQRIYAGNSLNDQERLNLAFALGKAYEDIEDYETAFRYFLEANEIKRRNIQYSIGETERHFHDIKNFFTETYFRTTTPAHQDDRTPIFIIGMIRSGTTLVEQILASHDEVSGGGELLYLDEIVIGKCGGYLSDQFFKSFSDLSMENLEHLGRSYLAKLKMHGTHTRFITDKLPSNFQIVGIIHKIFPKAKIIHCRRNPVDTCLSIFNNYFPEGNHHYAYNMEELGQFYKLYDNLIRHWHDVLPGRVYDIQYEDLVSDQERETRKLLGHCDLSWDEKCMAFHRTRRSVETASAVQVRRPLYGDSVARYQRYEPWIGPLLCALDS